MSDILVSFAGGNAGSGSIVLNVAGAKAGQQIISVVSTNGTSVPFSNFTGFPGTVAFVPADGKIVQVTGDLTGINLIALLRG